MDASILKQQEALLKEREGLLEEKKRQNAREDFMAFCEYVVKDESSGAKIELAELQKTWIRHISFCKANNLNCLILAPMSSGKCMAPDTPVLTQAGYVEAESIEPGDRVLSYDEENRKPVWKPVSKKESFEKKCIEVTFKSGRRITVSEDHPFLTDSGWIEAQDLRPKKDKVKTLIKWEKEHVLDMYTTTDAYMIGCILAKNTDYYGAKDGAIGFYSDFSKERDVEFDPYKFSKNKDYKSDYYTRAIGTYDLCEQDIINQISLHSKKVVKFFLKGYFDCLGVWDKEQKIIYMATDSKSLANGIQRLLQYTCGESSVENLILLDEELLTQQKQRQPHAQAGIVGNDAEEPDNVSGVTWDPEIKRVIAVVLKDEQIPEFTRILGIV